MPAKLTEDQRRLAADPAYLGFARGLAIRAARTSPWNADDLESAANWALCIAAMSFDPSRGVPFRAHAAIRIRGALADVARARARRHHVSLSELPAILFEPADPLSGIGYEPDDPEAIGEAVPTVQTLASRLPERHARALIVRYGGDEQLSLTQAASVLGLTRSRVARILAECRLILTLGPERAKALMIRPPRRKGKSGAA